VVHEPEHRRCTCAVRVLVLHRDERVVGGYRNHHDGHDLALHLYMCVEHESVLRRGVNDLLVRHHDGHVVHALVLRRCTCAVRELVLRLYGNDLLVHHRDGRVVRALVLRRCTCAVRELDVHLHNDRENL
jgi:hypothetical protein